MKKLLILTASNNHNLALAKSVETRAKDKGLSVQVLDMISLAWPLFTPQSSPDSIVSIL